MDRADSDEKSAYQRKSRNRSVFACFSTPAAAGNSCKQPEESPLGDSKRKTADFISRKNRITAVSEDFLTPAAPGDYGGLEEWKDLLPRIFTPAAAAAAATIFKKDLLPFRKVLFLFNRT